ncbi:ATP-binding component of high-affinity branched-chain amino acid transport system [Atlantibacter hermannii]|nr:ATP-binding component of high-affinity branched-chain amino acid transport system [Atlantibacter hermannii]
MISLPLTTAATQRRPRLSLALGGVILAALLVLPFLALLPATHPLHLSEWMLTLLGKILCYAIMAVALDLVWGYAGMLSLGHGLFFALGGYAMGMYLMRQAAGDGLPGFMSFLSWTELPWYWFGTSSFLWTLMLIVLVPGLLALLFGYFAFRSKIKGVYFSIMTQALTWAGMLLFFRNETGFGGNNGFTGFTTLLGMPVTATGTRIGLFVATVLVLALSLVIGWGLAKSKFGRVLTAVRDAESRLTFCGYDPKGFKLLVWTLSAVLCGLAGALYVPQVGIINPGEMSPTNSIEAAIWVALGGRGTLIGPVIGAGLVNGAKSLFTVTMPEYWLLFLGLMFILVTRFLPRRRSWANQARQIMMQPDEGLFTRQQVTDRYRAQTDPVLQLENISVSFDGFKALTDLSLQIGVGELRCIIGPNGAGKTTLMDVITGKTRPQSGRAIYDQTTDLTALSSIEIARQGIGRKFQKPTVFEALSVV